MQAKLSSILDHVYWKGPTVINVTSFSSISYFSELYFSNSGIDLKNVIRTKTLTSGQVWYPACNALQTCLKPESYDVSFESVDKNNKKCTPKQSMLYLLGSHSATIIQNTVTHFVWLDGGSSKLLFSV